MWNHKECSPSSIHEGPDKKVTVDRPFKAVHAPLLLVPVLFSLSVFLNESKFSHVSVLMDVPFPFADFFHVDRLAGLRMGTSFLPIN